MMQDCYRYCTACTQWAQSPSYDLRKGAIADCFECTLKFRRRRLKFSFIKHQDCSVIAIYNMYTLALCGIVLALSHGAS